MHYDVETLWAVGREYDDLSNMKEEEYVELLKEHTYSTVDDLEPIDVNVSEDKFG